MLWGMPITNVEKAELALEEHGEVTFFDKNNKRSVYNLVPPYMQKAIDNIPKEYHLLSEKQMQRAFRPSFEDSQMRMAFWTEYQRAQFTNTKMGMVSVYYHVYDQYTFTGGVVLDPKRLAWIIKPPAQWVSGMQVILNQGLQVMFDAIHADNIIMHGHLDPRVFNSVFKVIEMANIAMNGLPVIRTESKSVNMNVNQNTPAAALSEAQLSELQEQRAKLLEQKGSSQIKDVTPDEQ